MTKEQAIEVLNQALNQGFKAGVYTLQDAVYITDALDTLFNDKQETETK